MLYLTKEDWWGETAEKVDDGDGKVKKAFDFANASNQALAQQVQDMYGKKELFQKMCDAVAKNELVEVPLEEPTQEGGWQNNREEEMLVWYPRNTVGHGYNDNLATVGPIPHYNIQDLLARFFVQTHAEWGVVQNWRANIIGVTSCFFGAASLVRPGGAHLPMFDYDGKNVKKVIRKDVKLLQKDYGLGDGWVYETRRGFHVYFFSDIVSREDFHKMLAETQCCKGFGRSSIARGYAVLRVGAKYTDFDITPLYILKAKLTDLRRMTRKAHTIHALIELGQECGTHFASMYPKWAHFKQDLKEWKAPTRKPKAKRIKKTKYGGPEKGFFVETAEASGSDTVGINTTTSTTVTFNSALSSEQLYKQYTPYKKDNY